MRPKNRRPTAAAVIAAATMATCAALAAAPATAEYVIFHVYVSGENGGTIVVDDGPPVPEGTCGIRVYNPEAWYWSEGDVSEIGELDVDNNGDPTGVIEITGAYEGCDQVPYHAVTPSTPTGWVPDGALSLVIEGWSDDVEYLDSNDDPIPSENPGGGGGGICETWPDVCGGSSIASLTYCQRFPDQCYRFVSAGLSFVQASDLGTSATTQISIALQRLATPGHLPAALAALTLAQKRVELATRAVTQLRRQDDDVALALGTASHHPNTLAVADRASARTEIANRWFTRCAKDLETARRRLAGGSTPNLTLATTTCTRAAEVIEGGRAANDALTAWALEWEQVATPPR